jgi:hypothetical protein
VNIFAIFCTERKCGVFVILTVLCMVKCKFCEGDVL